MAQGQEQQQTAVGPCAGTRHVLQAGAHQEREVAVGELHAFRGAGGAGRVNDGGAVVAVGGALVFPEFGIGDAFAIGLDGVQAACFDDEHVAQGGHLAAHGFNLVALPVIFGDGERDFGIVENPADLAGGVGLIYRHGECADGHDRHIQSGPLPTRARHDGHGVALVDAQTNQAFGQIDDHVAEDLGAVRLPGAILSFIFDHGAIGIALGSLIEQIEQVDVAVNRLLDGIGELLDDTSIVYGLISDVFSHTPHVTPRMLQNTRETTDCPDQMAPAIRYFGQTR